MEIDNGLINITRRSLLKMAAMTGTAGIVSAFGTRLSPTLAAVSNMQQHRDSNRAIAGLSPAINDLTIVNFAIQLEQKAINTYVGVEKQKLIQSKELLEVARQFAEDHSAHRDALIKAVNEELKGTPATIDGLGTYPIPAEAVKKEAEAVRYALILELIASKVYYDAFKGKLKSKAARDLVIKILPVETEHVGVFRSVLKLKLKYKELPDNSRLVPFAFLSKQPTPEAPKGFSLDLEEEEKASAP